MKFTYQWLKDFVDFKMKPQLLAEKLTMAGLEVKSLEEKEDDYVFEVEITSNRPDWLSVAGIAREVAAITDTDFRLPRLISAAKPQLPRKAASSFKVCIENKKDCPLYTAKVIDSVKIGPSPDWLKKRLELVGCRSINNVVDITNYILFEWGQPLHAFDLDCLEPGPIFVRRAKPGERIVSIDGQELKLESSMLVIADDKRPVAVAGVMGGKETEVTGKTRSVLLEAAVFDPLVIRHTRRALGLSTESSYRFERGVDSEALEKVSLLATGLIQEVCSGKLSRAGQAGSCRVSRRMVSLDLERMERVLGISVGAKKAKSILTHLGFKVRSRGKNVLVAQSPSHRQDVAVEMDLVEEVARIYGYENIPVTLPPVAPEMVAPGKREWTALLKSALVAQGFQEVITLSLIDRRTLSLFDIGEEPVAITNPLSQDQELLRPTLIPGLVRAVAHNLNQRQPYLSIFEAANIFFSSGNKVKEDMSLGLAVCGEKLIWDGKRHIREEAGFLHLKGALTAAFGKIGISEKEVTFEPLPPCGFKVMVKGRVAGKMAELSAAVLAGFEIKNKRLFCAEIGLENIWPSVSLDKKFIPFSRLPAVSRDISFVVAGELGVSCVMDAIRDAGKPLLSEVKFVELYEGEKIGPGRKNLLVSCIYSSQKETLTELQVNAAHEGVLERLKKDFQAEIR